MISESYDTLPPPILVIHLHNQEKEMSLGLNARVVSDHASEKMAVTQGKYRDFLFSLFPHHVRVLICELTAEIETFTVGMRFSHKVAGLTLHEEHFMILQVEMDKGSYCLVKVIHLMVNVIYPCGNNMNLRRMKQTNVTLFRCKSHFM